MLLYVLNFLGSLLLHFAQPLLVFLHEIDFLGLLLLIDFRLIFFDRVCDKQSRARFFNLLKILRLWLLGCFSGIGAERGELSDFLRVFFLWPGKDGWEHGPSSTTEVVSVFRGGKRVTAATVGLGLRASYL